MNRADIHHNGKYHDYCQTHRKEFPTGYAALKLVTLRTERLYREDGRALCLVVDCHRVARQSVSRKGVRYAQRLCEFHGRTSNHFMRLEDKRNWGRKKRYGLSPDQMSDLKNTQHNRCAICDDELIDENNLTHVDHDHKTGKVRGLLCRPCNQGIGKFKDDPSLLERATNYLRTRGVG